MTEIRLSVRTPYQLVIQILVVVLIILGYVQMV